MKRWMKLAAVPAVAAIVAGLSGGAGATSSPAGATKATSSAATQRAPSGRAALLRQANLKTAAGVKRYLRAIGVNPRGVVIQRGVRNYAGPSCPGAGWSCTSTAHPVVQIAAAGGKNTFLCTTGSCAVVQTTRSATATKTTRSLTAAAAMNKATCIKTTGVTQSCSINQTNATANNQAIVVENIPKTAGLTQTVSATAQITQRATGTANKNIACVYQNVAVDGSTGVAKKGVPVTVTLEAHQSISITQDAAAGGNTVQNATAPPAAAACASGALTQTQTLSSTATGSGLVNQYENQSSSGPNVALDIEQNQSSGFLGNPSVSGVNNAAFNQTSALTAIAVTPTGAVNQTQSSASGGIQAVVNQWSHDDAHPSTIGATQLETQCEHAQFSSTPSPSCSLTETMFPPTQYSPTQFQFGPVKNTGGRLPTAGSRSLATVRKDPGSTQGDNPNDVFTVNQTTVQNNDTGNHQTNTVQGDCSTSGNCTVTQNATVDAGPTTTNVQSGQDVSTSTNCTGTTCTTPTITFDGSPGTNAPPDTLGPYTMTKFGPDSRPNGDTVNDVSGPTGTVGFSPPLIHTTVGTGWATWSNGYTGDVYFPATGSTITITLPAGTGAFYLYAEPNTLSPFDVQATAQDGTTSGPILVDGNGGAQYFGFYGTGGATIATVTVTTADTAGLGVGEFGISAAP